MTRKADPTHAGGIVYRMGDDGPRYLVVTARRVRTHWVFPKGHIENGEKPRKAARREVWEEAGVRSKSPKYLGRVEFQTPRGNVSAVFYLLRTFGRDVESEEGREIRWCGYDEARKLLSFESSRELLDSAHAMVLSQAKE
jgi:8-oxo-dGTP pyrophosphatase MutT (NUDIX family)